MTNTAQPGGNVASDAAAAADQSATANLSAALDQLWVRFLPEIRKRVDALDAAATACAAKELSAEAREIARAAAHKLAGTLGTFNLARGTELARECEVLFAEENGPDCSQGERLIAIAGELRTIVESRK